MKIDGRLFPMSFSSGTQTKIKYIGNPSNAESILTAFWIQILKKVFGASKKIICLFALT